MAAAIITIRLDEQSLAELRATTAACNRVLAALSVAEEKFMALDQDVQAALDEMTAVETDAAALKIGIDALLARIGTTGMSAEDRAALQALGQRLQTHAAALEADTASTAPPTP